MLLVEDGGVRAAHRVHAHDAELARVRMLLLELVRVCIEVLLVGPRKVVRVGGGGGLGHGASEMVERCVGLRSVAFG